MRAHGLKQQTTRSRLQKALPRKRAKNDTSVLKKYIIYEACMNDTYMNMINIWYMYLDVLCLMCHVMCFYKYRVRQKTY